MRLLILLLFCAGFLAVFGTSPLTTSSPGSSTSSTEKPELYGKAYNDAIETCKVLRQAVVTKNTELFRKITGTKKLDKDSAEQIFESWANLYVHVWWAKLSGAGEIEAEVYLSDSGYHCVTKAFFKSSPETPTGWMIARIVEGVWKVNKQK